jgi:hypothetical protein
VDQIRTILELLRGRLNEFLQNAEPRSDDWVILSNVVDHDGKVVEAANNKVVISLADIRRDAASANMPLPHGGGTASPPLNVNLLLVFFANFANVQYAEGLSAISRTIGFFHRTPIFTPGNLPGLDPSIAKLTMVPVNLVLSDQQALRDMLGLRHLPAVTYELRSVPIVGSATHTTAPIAHG